MFSNTEFNNCIVRKHPIWMTATGDNCFTQLHIRKLLNNKFEKQKILKDRQIVADSFKNFFTHHSKDIQAKNYSGNYCSRTSQMELRWWINYLTNFRRAILHHHWNWILASKAKKGSQNTLSEIQKRKRWLGQKEMQLIINVWETVNMISPYVNIKSCKRTGISNLSNDHKGV